MEAMDRVAAGIACILNMLRLSIFFRLSLSAMPWPMFLATTSQSFSSNSARENASSCNSLVAFSMIDFSGAVFLTTAHTWS